jgi:hypothetical protein
VTAAATVPDRLVAVARALHPSLAQEVSTQLREAPAVDPNRLGGVLARALAGTAARVIVTGTLDRRLVLLRSTGGNWLLADLSGQPHGTRAWPRWAQDGIGIADAGRWLSPARVTGEAVRRLTSPRVLLVALYHPEHFPLPRFPLAISDLARAARGTLSLDPPP